MLSTESKEIRKLQYLDPTYAVMHIISVTSMFFPPGMRQKEI